MTQHHQGGPGPLTEIEEYFESLRSEGPMGTLKRMTGETPERTLSEDEALLLLSKIQCEHGDVRCDCTTDTSRYITLLLGHVLPSSALRLIAKKSLRLDATIHQLLLQQKNLTPEVRYLTLWGAVQGEESGMDLRELGLASRDELWFVSRMESLYWAPHWNELDILGVNVLALEPERWEIFVALMMAHDRETLGSFTPGKMEELFTCAQLA